MKHVTIIGGGPAALMLAAQLDPKAFKVTVYDQKKSVGRKFLVAGEGGLNLTYSTTTEKLIAQYHPEELMRSALTAFTNEDLIDWLRNIGVPTFVGSSNRVFPNAPLKPIEVLNKILTHVKAKKVAFTLDTKWTGWDNNGDLCFENDIVIKSDIVVFALGGASWKVTGSDGSWDTTFQDRGIRTVPFRAANCAFGVHWNKDFIKVHEGKPLKNIAVSYKGHSAKGELVISKFGLEGNAIYAMSQKIQEDLLTQGQVTIFLDVKPTMSVAQLKAKYKNASRSKVTDILRKDLNLDRTAISLLKQYTDRDTYSNPELLIAIIKAIPVTLEAAGPLDEAISSLGGIALDEIDAHFKSKKIPDTYLVGEMLDWYAPTGGYLLQGCFSMGFAVAKHLNDNLPDNS